jgi:hypothetical protein
MAGIGARTAHSQNSGERDRSHLFNSLDLDAGSKGEGAAMAHCRKIADAETEGTQQLMEFESLG